MKKNNAMIISLISIILFSTFFITILLFYSDIVILNSSLKNFSREYYDWYLDSYWNNNIGMLEVITSVIGMFFGLIFSLEFLYIISNEKYKDRIEKKYLIISIIGGFILNFLIFTFIKYKVEHYRLFMILIPTEILALILLNIVLKLKASFKLNPKITK